MRFLPDYFDQGVHRVFAEGKRQAVFQGELFGKILTASWTA